MKMTATAALDHLSNSIDKERVKAGRQELAARLVALVTAVEDDDLADEETPAAVWAALDYVRRWADETEGAVIDAAKEGRTWQQLADLSGGKYTSRQAVQRRRRELHSLGRRTTSGLMRRGAAVPTKTKLPDVELPAAPVSEQVELL